MLAATATSNLKPKGMSSPFLNLTPTSALSVHSMGKNRFGLHRGGSVPKSTFSTFVSSKRDDPWTDTRNVSYETASVRSTFLPLKMTSNLSFEPSPLPLPYDMIIIGRRETISSSLDKILQVLPKDNNKEEEEQGGGKQSSDQHSSHNMTPILNAMIKSIGKSGKATTFLPYSSSTTPDVSKLTLIILPDKVSRNNHSMSPHTITDSLQGVMEKSEKVQIHVIDHDMEKNMGAVAVAIARALPLYSSKSTTSSTAKMQTNEEEEIIKEQNISVLFHGKNGEVVDKEDLWKSARAVSDGVRLACRLGDMPPAELTPQTYAEECRKIAQDLEGVEFEEIVGDELRKRGYGGVYGVGMGAKIEPRLVIMKYSPKDVDAGKDVEMENIVLCGKGVVYDTGGLSLKPKTGMCGMKHDMGGSAGVLGGFTAAVELKVPKKITLILGIVENAIGPDSVRNDDILTMYSGKSVEINNTDAEGRLVLADCVAHASKHIDGANIILDMATLTGAQLVTTGKKHSGILAKSSQLEKRMFDCGLISGDLCYPMLYAPELLKSEFASKVADMKNSVKDRGNAQSSCAGHFIESHLDASYKGDWVHVDMAGPGAKNERATGYGVALVLSLLQAPGFWHE